MVKSLIENSKEGNSAAFEQLYQINVGHVYAVCLRLTGDKALSHQLTKKTFINAWTQISEYNGSRSFSSWLTKIAAFKVVEETKDEELTPLDIENIPANIIDENIFKLPTTERMVFVLHDIEKFSHEEVAEILTFPIKESKKLSIKARLKLMREIP